MKKIMIIVQNSFTDKRFIIIAMAMANFKIIEEVVKSVITQNFIIIKQMKDRLARIIKNLIFIYLVEL